MESVIFESFRRHSDEHVARQMAAYMKSRFPFLGIQTPLRRALAKDFLKQLCQSEEINWPFVFKCFKQDEREYHYLALDYLVRLQTRLLRQDIGIIEQLIQTKSWWDSVDSLDHVVGSMLLVHPVLKDTHIRKWMRAENIWLKRVAIDCQLGFKAQTDSRLLTDAIEANLGSAEFFVNKAIGWSLRDYSKTNRRWVADFVEEHRPRMHSLSIREGSKYL